MTWFDPNAEGLPKRVASTGPYAGRHRPTMPWPRPLMAGPSKGAAAVRRQP